MAAAEAAALDISTHSYNIIYSFICYPIRLIECISSHSNALASTSQSIVYTLTVNKIIHGRWIRLCGALALTITIVTTYWSIFFCLLFHSSMEQLDKLQVSTGFIDFSTQTKCVESDNRNNDEKLRIQPI